MKKSELEALGLSAETIKAIQIIHGRDINALQAKGGAKTQNKDIRDAISAMLPMIRKRENLTELLRRVNSLYYIENRAERPQEPTKATEEAQPPEVTETPESAGEGAGEDA